MEVRPYTIPSLIRNLTYMCQLLTLNLLTGDILRGYNQMSNLASGRWAVRDSFLFLFRASICANDSKAMVTVGAMLEEPYQEGAGLKIIGSAMMAHAATKEEVLEMIEKDIYIESGVWDLEKVRV